LFFVQFIPRSFALLQVSRGKPKSLRILPLHILAVAKYAPFLPLLSPVLTFPMKVAVSDLTKVPDSYIALMRGPDGHTKPYTGESAIKEKSMDVGQSRNSSTTYQWLPAEFGIDKSGKASVLSYINNLDPSIHLAPLSYTIHLISQPFSFIILSSYFKEISRI
jgi:hypothetical protein